MATSLRVPDETRQGFEELAQLSGRTRSELMIEALHEYLTVKRQRIALIQEGEAALNEMLCSYSAWRAFVFVRL